MRISYITETYPPEINGVSLSVARAVRFLRDRGHMLELIRPRQRHEKALDAPDELLTTGLPLPRYPELRCGLATTGRLIKRFEASRPELVHIATQGPLGLAALRAARRMGVPVSADFRTNFHTYSRYYGLGFMLPHVRGYLRAFHNRAQLNFVPSRLMMQSLENEGFQRLALVGRGVDTALFSPEQRDPALREAWGAEPNERVLLYVGRLAREKNVALALRAMEVMRFLRPRTRMIVVGDGPIRAQLEKDFPAVRFVGMQRGEELARHYASADVFLFPSESETFGNVTLEALASGLAVVAFNLAAAADHIWHRNSGFLVAPGNYGGFIETVRHCMAMNAQAFTTLRQEARETAKAATWEAELGRFEKYLVQAAHSKNLERQTHVLTA